MITSRHSHRSPNTAQKRPLLAWEQPLTIARGSATPRAVILDTYGLFFEGIDEDAAEKMGE